LAAESLWSFDEFEAVFADVVDPRRDHLKRYGLSEVLVLVVSGVLAQCESWEDIADHGEDRHAWFRERGMFLVSTPSHDTLTRIFRLLDARAFARSLARWAQQAVGPVTGVVAIDGKTARASTDGDDGRAVHTVSAYATATGVSLAHVEVDQKSNEITAIPQVLDLVAVKGCTVTIDAMGCQKDIAERIRRDGGDYLLQVKANQSGTLNDLVAFFADGDARGWKGIDHTSASTTDTGHGRHEIRDAIACPISGPWMDAHRWKDLRQVLRIRRQRTSNGVTTSEDHFYISSDNANATRLLTCARQHWGIENSCHWVLDVAFNEDRCRIRKDHAAHNFVTVRRFVLNLLRLNQDMDKKKMSLRRRRKRAARNDDYLMTLLRRIAQPVSHGG
jgi:predicted transposase YbfD/YdcC